MRWLAWLLPCVALVGEDRFVGSKACQPCHPKISASYAATAMARSSGRVNEAPLSESLKNSKFQHARSGYEYRVLQDNGRLFLEFEKGDVQGRREMPFYIGSGAVARSYLLDADGFLYQSPVAYYSAAERWDLAPAYGGYDRPFLTRPIVPGCLQCHASRLQHRSETQNEYNAPPFLEGGVSCERCHGPGAAHVVSKRAKDIVHPGKLDVERRDSVCAQCHLSGEVRVTRAGRDAQFVAGERLADHVTTFVRSGVSAALKVTSHVENLAQSACKQASGTKLWCGSCHDPHTEPATAERASWFRTKCLGCHAKNTCKAPVAVRQRKADDCVACHMPPSPVIDAQHVVYTNHSIPRIAKPRVGAATAGDAALIPFGKRQSENPDARDVGIAYAIVAQRDHKPPDAARALETLTASVQAGSVDAEALLYLADLYKRNSDPKRAIELTEKAYALDPKQLTASVSLGAIRMEQGNVAEAIRLWTDALSKNPGLVLVRFNLAVALLKSNDRAGAEQHLQRVLFFDPAFAPARQLIHELRRNR